MGSELDSIAVTIDAASKMEFNTGAGHRDVQLGPVLAAKVVGIVTDDALGTNMLVRLGDVLDLLRGKKQIAMGGTIFREEWIADLIERHYLEEAREEE